MATKDPNCTCLWSPVHGRIFCQPCRRELDGKPLKVNAFYPSERTKVCDHPSGFAYTGSISGTGPRTCHLCGTNELDT